MYLYIEKQSFLHKLHPVTKIFLMLFGFLIAIVFNSPLYLAPFLLIMVFLLILAGGARNLYSMRVILILLFLFSSILWSFFIKSGEVIFRLGSFTVTDKSFAYGIGMGLRLDLMVLSGLLFFSITMVEEFSFGLYRLGIPYPFCFAVSLAFRFVPLFLKEASIVVEAQTLRGLDLSGGNIFSRIKRHLPLVVPIFIATIKGMDNLTLALEAKGFNPTRKRTFLLDKRIKIYDYLIISSLVLVLFLSLILRINHYGVVLDRL